MVNHLGHVRAAVRAVRILSPVRFSWVRRRSPLLLERVQRELAPKTARSYLVLMLQSEMYRNFYCTGGVMLARATGSVPAIASIERIEFLAALSQANRGHGHWEPGWALRDHYEGGLVAQRADLRLYLQNGEWRPPTSMADTQFISIRLPKEMLNISPNFLVVLGDNPPIGGTPLVRLYWNVTPFAAIEFIRMVTPALNDMGIAFRLKVLSEPQLFDRCDALVLYIQKTDISRARPVLSDAYAHISAELRPRTPIFTKPLAAGVGLAENPENGESFGWHRCGLLAEGIVRAHESAKRQVDDRVQSVIEVFGERGIKISAPFLNSDRADDYEIDLGGPAAFCAAPSKPDVATFQSDTALRTAVNIGLSLCKTAIWNERYCNWMAPIPEEPDEGGIRRSPGPTYRNLEADIYLGTGGIGLFLGELAAVIDNDVVRQTALGAVRHALALAHKLPISQYFGLLGGVFGIALVGVRIGILLKADDLVQESCRLVREAIRAYPDTAAFNLTSGAAGVILALLSLARSATDVSLIEAAKRLGNLLIDNAVVDDYGISWNSPDKRTKALLGLSHGTAGVGLGLLELFSATREDKYRLAAERAFSYERRWFSEDAGNWPDFRRRHSNRDVRPSQSFATHWCHGAPGIAISRVRAYQILKDPRYRTEALTALATTKESLEFALRENTGNYSLCHGLAGNCEILVGLTEALGESTSGPVALAQKVAAAGQERFELKGIPWPCGGGRRELPGLFLGTAGIGLHYLRLARAAIPSPLFLFLDTRQ